MSWLHLIGYIRGHAERVQAQRSGGEGPAGRSAEPGRQAGGAEGAASAGALLQWAPTQQRPCPGPGGQPGWPSKAAISTINGVLCTDAAFTSSRSLILPAAPLAGLVIQCNLSTAHLEIKEKLKAPGQ